MSARFCFIARSIQLLSSMGFGLGNGKSSPGAESVETYSPVISRRNSRDVASSRLACISEATV